MLLNTREDVLVGGRAHPGVQMPAILEHLSLVADAAVSLREGGEGCVGVLGRVNLVLRSREEENGQTLEAGDVLRCDEALVLRVGHDFVGALVHQVVQVRH